MVLLRKSERTTIAKLRSQLAWSKSQSAISIQAAGGISGMNHSDANTMSLSCST